MSRSHLTLTKLDSRLQSHENYFTSYRTCPVLFTVPRNQKFEHYAQCCTSTDLLAYLFQDPTRNSLLPLPGHVSRPSQPMLLQGLNYFWPVVQFVNSSFLCPYLHSQLSSSYNLP